MRKLKFTLLALFATTLLAAQSASGLWETVDEDRIQMEANAEIGTLPSEYHTFALDLEGMRATLSKAPLKENKDLQKPLELDLPLANGQIMTFEVYESSVMMPKLAAKFPQIRSYQGVGKGNSDYSIRVDCNTLGLFVRMRTPDGLTHIMPYATKQDKYYMSFFRKDLSIDEGWDKKCGVSGHESIDFETPINVEEIKENIDATTPFIEKKVGSNGIVHRTYRMAIASTAEYTIQIGGVAAMMSRMVMATNTLNEIYERELAVTFMMIDNNEILIQTDPEDQPYTDVHLGRTVLGQNHGVLVDKIGVDAFDIGHVFTISCTDGILGVAALGSLCNDDNKGTGVTCGYTNDIVLMASETMAHEVGHQFAASHSWNYCSPLDPSNPNDDPMRDENRSATTAFEPGSGTTIMSYAGVCSAGQNVQFTNDTYFHIGSHLQMSNHQNNENVVDCGEIVTLNNEYPEVSVKYENGFSIPINTPFMLTAEATDADGDELLYCWEQVNRHFEEVPLGTQTNDSPSFRSFEPTESNTRVFPSAFPIIIGNTFNLDDELLPDYSRNLKFRCSVRDQKTGIAGNVWTDEVSFEATESAGPFVVSSQNSTGIEWEVGSEQEVTWDVANTDQSPVNAKSVNIMLLPEIFTDNRDFSQPVMLAANVPNDGSHMVIVPNVLTNTGRVMIKAADNIFFDITDENLRVVPPTEPGFLFYAGPYSQQVCLPAAAVAIDLTVDSLLGYDSLLSFAVTGLPNGAVANFSSNPARPSEDVTLTIDMSTVSFTGVSDITISAEGPNLPIVNRVVKMDFVDTDFSAMALSAPIEGALGVEEVPTFSWSDLPNADSYTIEIATNPAFGANVVETVSGITDNSFVPTIVLEKSTVYFWRVIPVNACGSGDASSISTFQTETLNCNAFESGSVDLSIPVQTNATVSSTINISGGGTINDINVSNIMINYSPINAILIELEGPGGQKIVLFDGNCGNTSSMDIGFDNEAPNPIQSTCPPTGGGVAKPIGDLSSLYGSNAEGDWKLTVTVKEPGFSPGSLVKWSLDICSSSSVAGPALITNEVLPVKPDDGQWISSLYLKVTDPNQPSSELVYTIVELPEYGRLEMETGTVLNVGDTFTQSDLGNTRVAYFHEGATVTEDGFFFTVDDGEGGYIGKTKFNINIDDSNLPLSTAEILALEWGIFPNPAKDQVTLNLGQAATQDLLIRVVNIQGQLVDSKQIGQGQQQLRFNVAQWPVGMYFVEMSDGKAISTEKIVIQR